MHLLLCERSCTESEIKRLHAIVCHDHLIRKINLLQCPQSQSLVIEIVFYQ